MANLDKSFWSRWEVMLVVFIVIISLVIAGGFVSYNVISSTQNSVESGISVKTGDTVTVNYIGMFEDGTVFDTSLMSVAQNNSLYPKSLSFNERVEYSPLNFTIGAGQMIKGFDKGVIGMTLNQTKVVVIAPDEAYGYSQESMLVTRDLTESIPIYEWFGNVSDFIDTFDVTPLVGTTIKNHIMGWNMTVSHVDPTNGLVLLKNNPALNEILPLSTGWNYRVMSIDSSANNGNGVIIVKHLISNEDIGTRMFTDTQGQQFTISQTDTASNTFTMDYNREVVGKTLMFKITLVSITASTSEI